MFADLTYKKRLYLLITAGFIGIIIIYQVAIKETLTLRSEVKDNENKIIELSQAPQEFAKLESELEGLYKNMGTESNGNDKFREQLLEETTNHCRMLGITLREFPQSHLYNESDYTVHTYSIVAEGNFLKLQKLVYIIETGFGKGKVPSVQYFIKSDFKTGKKSLFLQLIIQYITKNEKHENSLFHE